MRDYEVTFVSRMRDRMEEGMNFAEVAQESLADNRGESPSEVLFKMIGKAGVMQPEPFVARVSSVLGEGARTIFASIEDRADRWRELSAESVPASAYESLMGSLVVVCQGQAGGSATALLHDHRIRDQLGTYAEDG